MIRNLFAILVAALLAAFIGLAMHGCLDVVVIHVDEPGSDGGDGGPLRDLDAPSDGPRPCEVCMRAPSDPGPGCADVMATCAADTPCSLTIECAMAAGCLELSGQGAIIDCGTPCGRDAGLDLSSPSISYILAVVACAQESCGPICRGEVPPPD